MPLMRCPVCRAALLHPAVGTALTRCPAGHTFDAFGNRARDVEPLDVDLWPDGLMGSLTIGGVRYQWTLGSVSRSG